MQPSPTDPCERVEFGGSYDKNRELFGLYKLLSYDDMTGRPYFMMNYSDRPKMLQRGALIGCLGCGFPLGLLIVLVLYCNGKLAIIDDPNSHWMLWMWICIFLVAMTALGGALGLAVCGAPRFVDNRPRFLYYTRQDKGVWRIGAVLGSAQDSDSSWRVYSNALWPTQINNNGTENWNNRMVRGKWHSINSDKARVKCFKKRRASWRGSWTNAFVYPILSLLALWIPLSGALYYYCSLVEGAYLAKLREEFGFGKLLGHPTTEISEYANIESCE